MYNNIINLIHIFIVAPLFIAVGIGKFPPKYNNVFIILAIIIILYHGYKLIDRYNGNKLIKIISLSEGFEGTLDCTKENIHCVDVFDSHPGFSRPLIEIKINDIVIWKNIGEVEHNITSTDSEHGINPDGLFNSLYLKPGQGFAVQFIKSGTYNYYCVLNKGWMRGKIIIK